MSGRGGTETRPVARAEEVRARLAAAGIEAPAWSETVVVDLANDPPLCGSAAETALAEAARIVEGAGAAMLVTKARRGVIAVRDAAAHKAIATAIKAVDAKTLGVERVPDVWPSVGIDRDLGCPYPWILDGEQLLDLEAAAFARPRAPRRVTVAGAVAKPGVFAVQQNPAALQHGIPAGDGNSEDAIDSVEALVAAAGGSTAEADAWVALDGGPWGGALVDRDARVRRSLLVILPVTHPLVARARLSIADQLRRAASACEGCRACTDVCPPALDGIELAPHALVASLVSGDRGTVTASAAACVACGVCDAACPSGLSPATLVGTIRSHLPPSLPPLPRGEAHPDRAGRRMSIDLLLLRAGLAG